MKKTFHKVLALSVITLLTPSLAHGVPLVVKNFSFEADFARPGQGFPFAPPLYWNAFNEGSTGDFGSWNATGTSQFVTNNPLGAPADGAQYTYINVFSGHGFGGIYQDVGLLLADTTYTLTVAVGDRQDRTNSPGIISLLNGIDQNGDLLASSVSSNPTRTGTWTDLTISFTTGDVVSGDLTIQLSALGSPTLQADFDNVRLNASVPEPRTYALLGSGLALLSLIVLRRKQASV